MCTNLTLNNDCQWISPCESDAIIAVATNVFDHPLLCVDAVSPITGIESVHCYTGTFLQSPTSDPAYVCRIQACATQMGNFLSSRFSDYVSHISDRCHLNYTGPVLAGQVLIDLDSCRLIFRHFSISCSDVSICG